MPKRDIEAFISHWTGATASEQQISQPFLLDLCDLLDVPRPGNQRNGSYTFEFHVSELQPDGTTKDKRIDFYRRASFVLESKKFQEAKPDSSQVERTAQKIRELAAAKLGPRPKSKKSSEPRRDTTRWDDAMLKALLQAERYTRALPADEPYPPFVLVVDVGHVIEVRADFSLTGRAYQPFPDPLTYRIQLKQLRDEKVRERLKLIWTDPQALDPSKRSAEVTREVAKHLADLAKSFEKEKHAPKIVAEFLTRCLFCMFAEDVGLLPDSDGKHGFTALLKKLPANGDGFVERLRILFQEMNEGRNKEVSAILCRKLLKFNGGLFADNTVLPVNKDQLAILIDAAEKDWKLVEPAIFGTLLERALGGEGERHKLGAHFTPRSYVERLVMATIIEPLRAEWENVRAAAVQLGKRGEIDKARDIINQFHRRLCDLTVLDPACGSGNFLYVTLENLKRLEGEVLDFAGQFGESFKLEMAVDTVDPHQFLGLEINPRAAALAELVLWIGYLQWHFRTRGQTMPAEPVLKNFKNIQCRDAVLDCDEIKPARDAAGSEMKIWDRRSFKTDSLTGREVPDETKRVPLLTYENPRPAIWPEADFIVGNPPFIGNKRMRDFLGDGYAEALRAAYPEVSETADFVMYWWHKSAGLVRSGKAKRFGIITTNSLRMIFNSRVLQAELNTRPPLSLAFVIPDHPWVDTADGAAVRIAMTVGIAGKQNGELLESIEEKAQEDGSALVKFSSKHGIINSDLSMGVGLSEAKELKSNSGLSFMGIIPVGLGFVIEPSEIKGLGFDFKNLPPVIRPYLNGRDLTAESRAMFIIDFFGLTHSEARQRYPSLMQVVIDRVKPFRDTVARKNHRENWWIYGEARPGMRRALADLRRYIGTTETAKHRCFQFIKSEVLPDQKIRVIASDDAFTLGVLSSRLHIVWALATGGTLEDRPVYNNTTCFDRFPFPLCNELAKENIRKLAEELDAHRKYVQAKHGITLTGLYNVLEKIRAGETLTEKEKFVHDRGLVSTLKSLHDDLDAAVSAAYGWPVTLTDAEILERLVALNAERAAEERRGVIHWLRPEYQGHQQEIILTERKPKKKAKAAPAKRNGKAAWPKFLPERVRAVEMALHAAAAPVAPEDLAKQFARAKPADVAEILKTLETLGRARRAGEGKFRA